MPDKIEIKDYDNFQATINRLTELRNGIGEKVKALDAVTKAAVDEASKGVVTPGAEASGTGGVAAKYTETVTSLSTALTNVAAQANHAADAVQEANAELTSLLNGMREIDQSGAAATATA